jgi:hypothetical protein
MAAGRKSADTADELLARARNAEADKPTVDEIIAIKDAENRQWIAKFIMIGFLVTIGGSMLLMAGLAYSTMPDARWGAFSDKMLEILKAVLLPVITLLLGYAFGQTGKNGG